MRFLRNLPGHLFFVYAILMFAATMLVIFIPVWITTLFPEPRRTRLLHPIFRVWMGVYMPLVFSPVFRKGKHYFRPGENYVVVCNHNSFADVPVSSPWIPGANKTLAKVEMARIPLFGVIYKAGSILLDRKRPDSRRESFVKMQEMLGLGLHLCLYPEGTRNKTDKPLLPFYDGAFITAIKSGRPVIPALIFNTRKVLPHDKTAWVRPSFIHIHFLEPIPTAGMDASEAGALKDRVYELMNQYYLTHKAALS